MLNTQEHIDLMDMFEREHIGGRLDREDKQFWQMGLIYQNGETNSLFLAYRRGYAYGLAIGRRKRDAELPETV